MSTVSSRDYEGLLALFLFQQQASSSFVLSSSYLLVTVSMQLIQQKWRRSFSVVGGGNIVVVVVAVVRFVWFLLCVLFLLPRGVFSGRSSLIAFSLWLETDYSSFGTRRERKYVIVLYPRSFTIRKPLNQESALIRSNYKVNFRLCYPKKESTNESCFHSEIFRCVISITHRLCHLLILIKRASTETLHSVIIC